MSDARASVTEPAKRATSQANRNIGDPAYGVAWRLQPDEVTQDAARANRPLAA
jgi:hypothetical protein